MLKNWKTFILLTVSAANLFAAEQVVVPESLLKQVEDGNAEIAYFIASQFLEKKDDDNQSKGRDWMQKAAEMDYPLAMYELGQILASDEKRQTAFEWFKKAMDLGHAEATGLVGIYHYMGYAGLEKDSEKDCSVAYDYFQKAAAKKNETALNNYAWFLATSANKKCRNPERALKVFSDLKANYDGYSASMPWHFQDTESAVLAAIHDFDAAIKNQQRIIESRKENGLSVAGFEKRLSVFQSRKPYIEE